MAERQAGAGPQLTLVAIRYRYTEPRAKQPSLQWSQLTILGAGQVVPRGAWCRRRRERQIPGMRLAGEQHLDGALRRGLLRQRC
jgi:hypothetical protein